MAPKRRQSQRLRRNSSPTTDTPPPTQQEQIAQVVAQQIAAAIPAIVAQLNQNRNSGTIPLETQTQELCENLERRSESTEGSERQGCSYKTFMSCKPKEFNGKEGAVQALRWLEEIEAVIDISGCADNNKVKFATHSFKGEALSWWNMILQSNGRDAMNNMGWEEFKTLMIEKYCPYSEIEKLETEFLKLEMVGAAHQDYTNRFNELSRLVPHLVATHEERNCFICWQVFDLF